MKNLKAAGISWSNSELTHPDSPPSGLSKHVKLDEFIMLQRRCNHDADASGELKRTPQSRWAVRPYLPRFVRHFEFQIEP